MNNEFKQIANMNYEMFIYAKSEYISNEFSLNEPISR